MQKVLKERGYGEDQSDQILIRQKPSATSGFKMEGVPSKDEQEAELTEFEKQCLQRFDQNDAEIDEMLEIVIGQLDRIILHA